MRNLQCLRRRLLVTVLFALATLALPGCVPTVWLPDSSGFVYVKQIPGKQPFEPPTGGQLLHYDLQKKASRVVVADIGPGTIWPAVSPDGKRIAVARFNGAVQEAKTVQVVIYDLQGKELQKSKELAWTPASKDNFLGEVGMLFWSPKEDMLVVTDFNVTGIFNVAAQSIKMLPKATPSIYGGSPIRPDGKGFLVVMQDQGKKTRLVFVDWTGKEQTIDAAAIVKAMPPKEGGVGDDPIGGFALVPLLIPTWWEGNTATMGFKRKKATCQIDTVKQVASVSDAFVAMVKKKDDPKMSEPIYFDFAGDVSVEVLEFKEEAQAPNPPKQFHRVTIINHKTGKSQVVEPKGAQMAMFSASPDGNFLALSLSKGLGDQQGPAGQILIISSKGEVYSKVPLD